MKYSIKGFAVSNCNNELTFTGVNEEYSQECVEHLNHKGENKPYKLVYVDTTIEV